MNKKNKKVDKKVELELSGMPPFNHDHFDISVACGLPWGFPEFLSNLIDSFSPSCEKKSQLVEKIEQECLKDPIFSRGMILLFVKMRDTLMEYWARELAYEASLKTKKGEPK